MTSTQTLSPFEAPKSQATSPQDAWTLLRDLIQPKHQIVLPEQTQR